MTAPTSPARRRAETAFALLTQGASPLTRALDEAQSDADARAQKTLRLRNARLERERNGQPTPRTNAAERADR